MILLHFRRIYTWDFGCIQCKKNARITLRSLSILKSCFPFIFCLYFVNIVIYQSYIIIIIIICTEIWLKRSYYSSRGWSCYVLIYFRCVFTARRKVINAVYTLLLLYSFKITFVCDNQHHHILHYVYYVWHSRYGKLFYFNNVKL